MIILFALIAIPMIVWMPWWALCILCTGFGFLKPMSWKSAAAFAVLLAMIEAGAGVYFDHRAVGLVSQRLGGLFNAPYWVIYVVPTVMGAWIGLFFSRLGTSVRAFVVR